MSAFDPLQTYRLGGMLPPMGRFATAMLLIVTLMALGSCTEKKPLALGPAQAQQCRASGGYESRAPFGTPMCQKRFADAGKTCTGKAECLGQCFIDTPDRTSAFTVGMPAIGRCQAEEQTFGCYGRVEDGKLVKDYGCID